MSEKNTIQLKHLVGSKWTDLAPQHDRKHFEVLAFEAETGRVTLVCILDNSRQVVDLSDFKNRDIWLPGWH